MSKGTSLTDAVKLTAGVSLTRAVKDAAGCRIRFIEEVLDTRDDGSQTAAARPARLPFAVRTGLAALALLVTLFVGSVSTSTVPDMQRGSFPATARRVALVIGNSAYRHTTALANPKNDAAAMGAALKKLGFDVVEGLDLDKGAFDAMVDRFTRALNAVDVALFFYAGHGMQVSGRNYLVPVDAKLTTIAALDDEMVRLDLVHETMVQRAQTSLLFFDACRDNPLVRNLARTFGPHTPEVGRGLAAVQSGAGTLISFSTQPGNVALDGSGPNSPFSGALVRQLSASAEDLSTILIAVRNDVMSQTDRKQVPWEHSALTQRFYFNAPGSRPRPERPSS
jgi:uncharacterized caspase-like protein